MPVRQRRATPSRRSPDVAERVVIVAVGASTPLGRDAWSSAAAVRAGISGLAQHPYMIDTAGEPMKVVAAPWLEIGLGGLDRLDALLAPAIEESLAVLDDAGGRPLRMALSLGLPAARPGLPDDMESLMRQRVRDRFGSRFEAIAAFPSGHAAGLLALQAAQVKLGQGGLDACVVAGVDSYLEPETLEWLENCEQLHGAGPHNNAWGFIPGEGAGALLLMRQSVADAARLVPLAVVLSSGGAIEANRIKTETVCLAVGLTDAVRAALSGLPAGQRVTDVYCDLNGEPYRSDEFGFAVMRTGEAFVSASDFIAPADCWGDVCAASGLLNVMLATIAGQKSYSNGPLALAVASAEAGERAAVLIATAGREIR
jgi:3-oxoacyl-[acyl-carrier-protein] synthase I